MFLSFYFFIIYFSQHVGILCMQTELKAHFLKNQEINPLLIKKKILCDLFSDLRQL